jgi:iron complex outermembrane recepter protein
MGCSVKIQGPTLSFLALALFHGMQAKAAESPEPAGTEAEQLDEVVVTAQFREQNVQDTPIAITAVSSEMMEARSQTSIQEVANQAPSVTLKPQGAMYGPSLSANIRGIGQHDFNPALEPGVGFYVDDVYFATLTGSVVDLLDLERVELLRGPQGTLSGRNSIGGAVKLFSKRPTGDNSGSVSMAYGSRDRIDLRGSIDFNIAEGIDMRLAGVSKKQGGYVKRLDFGCVYPAGGPATFTRAYPIAGAPDTLLVNPVGGVPARTNRPDCLMADESEVNYNAARAQLRIRPNDSLDINITGDFTADDRNAAGGVLLLRSYPNGAVATPRFPLPALPPYANATPPGRDINPFAASSLLLSYDNRFLCGPYCNFATYDMPADGPYRASSGNGRVKFEGGGMSGQIDWDINDDFRLTSITAMRRYTSNFSNDNDVSPMAHSLGYGPLSFKFFSQELRLNGTFGEAVEYTLGGYYSDQKSVYSSFQDLRSSALQFQQNDPVHADSKAVFAHVAWKPLDPLTLTGGVRYTEESKSYQYNRQRPYNDPTSTTAGTLTPPTGVLPLDGTIGRYSGDRIDYRGNVQWAFNDDVMAYAQVSTGFKGGGVNPRPFFVEQALSFGPEKLTSYEAGLKTDLFDRKLRLNMAAYLSKYKDIQLTLSNCTAITGPGKGAPCAMPVNAGDADIKGVELETTFRPIRGMTIDGAVSYTDFKYTRFGSYTAVVNGVSSTVAVGGPTNLNGPQFGDYPVYAPKWKGSIGVQYEVGLGSAGSLTPRIDAASQGRLYTVSANRESNKIGGYAVANARLTWRNADDDLDVALEVTNLLDKYYLLTLFDQTVGGQGYAVGQPGRPREWAVTFKKRF